MQKKIIFYDLDGTLVDTRADIANAANHMLETMGRPTLTQREVEKYVGKGLYYLIEGCLQTTEKKVVEKGAKIYRDHYAAHMKDNSPLYPGALETLERFKKSIQAVVTNKPDPFSKDLLNHLKVDQFFVSIIPGNSKYPKKPDPTAVLELLEKHQVAPSDALFVGDGLIDLETGRNASVETVLLSHGFSTEEELAVGKPDYLVPDFEAFLKLSHEKGW